MTQDIGEAVVRIARRWIGTPYKHQTSCRGAGCDCLGLLRGVWRTLYGTEPGDVPVYTPDWCEAAGDERLWRAAKAYLVQVQDAGIGDVILLRMRNGAVAKHLGLQSRIGENAAFIHSYWGHGVVETPLTPPWARRIVARFQFPKEVR